MMPFHRFMPAWAVRRSNGQEAMSAADRPTRSPRLLGYCLGILVACSVNGDEEWWPPGPVGHPGARVLLHVEPDLQACAVPNTEYFRAEWPLRTRVSFMPGSIDLAECGADFEADLIESVEVGDSGITYAPLGRGTFTCRGDPAAEHGLLRYSFRQTFAAAAARLVVSLTVAVPVAGGGPLDPDPKLDGLSLAVGEHHQIRVSIVPASGEPAIIRTLTSCRYEGYVRSEHRVTLANGDRVEFEQYVLPSFCDPYQPLADRRMAVTAAHWESGEAEVTTADYFDGLLTTAPATGAGFPEPSLLLQFKPPLGSAHFGCLVALEDVSFTSALLLDEAMEPLEVIEVLEHAVHPRALACDVPGNYY